MGTLPIGRVLMDHRLPNQTGVDAPTKNVVTQLDRVDLFPLCVDNVKCHNFVADGAYSPPSDPLADICRGATALRITT